MYNWSMLEQMFLLNWILGTGTLLLEFFLLAVVLIFIFQKSILENLFKKYLNYLNSRNLLILIFILSFSSSILTLIYSEYFGQIPCALCWFQRIFLYGIVVLSGLGIYRREEKFILNYILSFSIFGALFSLYQHAEQMLALYGTHLPCPVSGADCAKMTVFEYSHITFPYMAFILFLFFILAISLNLKFQNRSS